MEYRDEFKKFRWANRTTRFVQISLCLLFAVVINVLAAQKFIRKDITQSHRYSLGPESAAYIREIKTDVDIFVTIPHKSNQDEVAELYDAVSNLLREYEYAGAQTGESGKIKIHYIDVLQQRKRAEMLTQKFGLQKENVVFVSSGDQYRVLLPSDFYSAEEGEIIGFKGEQAITSAILEVTNQESDKIYFLTGHGEMGVDDVSPLRGLSELNQLLLERNFSTDVIDLSLHEAIPKEASCLVIASPQSPILRSEIQKIRHYLEEHNGRVVILLNPMKRHGLDELMYEWGILSDDMVVVDLGKDFQAAEGDLIVRRYAEHPITQLLIDYQLPILAGLSRPVRLHPGAPLDERQTTKAFLATSNESWGERAYFDMDGMEFNAETDLKGPLSIAALTERRISSELGIHIPGGRMVVFGNADFIANNRFHTLGNQLLFINTILWGLDRDNPVNIPPKKFETVQLALSQQNLLHIALSLSILPFILLLLELFVWFRRRT